MTTPAAKLGRYMCAVFCVVTLLAAGSAHAQTEIKVYERTFPQSKTTIEQALKQMPAYLEGRLPVLEGFAIPAGHPLDHYRRAYYQSSVEVRASASGGSVVRVKATVTAWYADASRPGYQLLISNGRIETDLLDQLSDVLGGQTQVAASSPEPSSETVAPETSAATAAPAAQATETAGPRPETSAPAAQPVTPATETSSAATETGPAPTKTPTPAKEASVVAKAERNTQPQPSTPAPQLPETGGTFSSSLSQGLADQEKSSPSPAHNTLTNDDPELRAEAANLEEILKNQAHPRNLVAVKKSGTPVVATASLNAKTLFLASAHDEFELLDFNQDWVHVRISGLSRGWIWRNSVEMPNDIPDTAVDPGPAPAADVFHVSREETSSFPGDWAPLRGKSVKIISIQKNDETIKDTSAGIKLEFAKSVLDKNYSEMARRPQELAGIVLIFDSADGGMIAATLPALQQWKAGTLSDAALWRQCFFDPPEIFTTAASSARQ
jgi:hypothetical protein